MIKLLCLGCAIVVVSLLTPNRASAQHFIGGRPVSCTDFRGIPVVLIPNPNLNDVGWATLGPGGEPVMILNPLVINPLHPVFQLFWYAHECAHHALGHLANPSAFS